ncbi:MAG: ROK family protein [Deltaproteobacteria bacterium]|nr:ROK family protein [Deltaproteobacteria bacterium]
MSGTLTIGIDLGGTRVKAGVVDAAGAIVARRVEAVGADKDGAAVVARLAGVITGLQQECGLPVAAVGLAAAGVLDRARGVICESPNFPAWRDLALGRHLEAAVGLPVSLDNDANAVIYGEARAGAGRGAVNVVGFTLGTGVGGGIVLDGRLWRGTRGMAGELGHITVVPEGRPCGCGNRGCLEQYAGAVGLRQGLRDAGGDLARMADAPDAPERMAAQARAGNSRLRDIFDVMGDALGQAIATVVHTLDVQRIVLAGGLAPTADLFMPALTATFHARTFRSMAQGVRVLTGELGEDAGVVGAAIGCAR